jgi:hypothetical protein
LPMMGMLAIERSTVSCNSTVRATGEAARTKRSGCAQSFRMLRYTTPVSVAGRDQAPLTETSFVAASGAAKHETTRIAAASARGAARINERRLRSLRSILLLLRAGRRNLLSGGAASLAAAPLSVIRNERDSERQDVEISLG